MLHNLFKKQSFYVECWKRGQRIVVTPKAIALVLKPTFPFQLRPKVHIGYTNNDGLGISDYMQVTPVIEIEWVVHPRIIWPFFWRFFLFCSLDGRPWVPISRSATIFWWLFYNWGNLHLRGEALLWSNNMLLGLVLPRASTLQYS